MSKLQSESLHSLIKRLNKSEKWKFAVYANRHSGAQKKYIQLFNILNKQSRYDEKAILRNTEISAVQLPNTKAELYKHILHFLASNSNNIADSKTSNYIVIVKFLYSKCLFDDCVKIIDKAKLVARNNFNPTMLLELLELEKVCILKSKRDYPKERVDVLIEEVEKVSKQLNNINLVSNLSLKLNSLYQTLGFLRNKEDFTFIREYYHRYLPKLDLHDLSELELLNLYLTIVGYYLFIQDFKNAHRFAKKAIYLFDSNQQLIVAKTEMYIKTINYMLVCLNKLYLYKEFRQEQRRLIVLKRNKSLVCNDSIELSLFKCIYLHEINRHFMLGAFKEGTKVVAALEKELKKFIAILNTNTTIIFYYKIAALYIGSDQYKSALKWLHKILNAKTSEVRIDIQSFARILELICYFELKDTEIVEYKIKSTYRFLLKHNSFVKYQNIIMQFLRKMKRVNTRKSLMIEFTILKESLLILERNRFEKPAFIYFDIISWLESKIEKKPLQDVVIAKLKSKSL